MHAELEELICSGPRIGRQHSYMLCDERIPRRSSDAGSPESALEELLGRYLRSHGPATLRDFTTWSSMPMRESRAALARLGDTIATDEDENGNQRHFANHVASARLVSERGAGAFLLPMYDEMTVAYQDLRIVLDAPLPRSDFLERVVLIDGVTVGSWKRLLGRSSVDVVVRLLRALTFSEQNALDDVVARFGRFLGVPATLHVSDGLDAD
jgi:hypothetical protein